MANRLSSEKSPYLIQHAENPVDWHPWGEAAFEKARAENKPVLLSVGYATCHWCHVMAHESFEDHEVARLMNEHYVPVKVDREERPDVDQVYMAACQALTGQGGWPLTAFLTPEGRPFYVGTYFPKTSRFGRPGFIDLLGQLAEKWRTDNEIVRKAADQLTHALADRREAATAGLPGEEALSGGFRQLSEAHDAHWGGFGRAPKFPTPHYINFLLRWHHRTGDRTALSMAVKTLTAMRRGGIYDHLGFGFHRYSVDEKWLAPHFEKMLYDQALLIQAYAEAFQVTENPLLARTVRETAEYVLRDMTSPEGAFYTAEDADSEGEEGLFYVWTPGQVKEVLGDELGEIFCRAFDVTEAGNFEHGRSIPHLPRPLNDVARELGLSPEALEARLSECRARLFEAREARVRPLKDDKVLTGWNGMMIAALAKAGQVLDEEDYIRAAGRSADFILSAMKTSGGRLMRRYRHGESAHPGFLEDYAFLIWGLIDLYESCFEVRYLEEALSLNAVLLDLFGDERDGGLFFSGSDNEALITRQKEVYDGAIPSGNSVAAMNLLRLGRLTGDAGLEARADLLMRAFFGAAARVPMAHTHLLMALDFAIGPTREMVVVGDAGDEEVRRMIRAVRSRFIPRKVVLHVPQGEAGGRLAQVAPFVEAMGGGESPAFYMCSQYACERPLTDAGAVEELIEAAAGPSAPAKQARDDQPV